MLHELTIRNFAIIDDLHLTFGPGLNILTGETGAGKSIIIDALGLLLGDRGATEWIRAGTDQAQIEAVFQLNAPGDNPSALNSTNAGADNGADGSAHDTVHNTVHDAERNSATNDIADQVAHLLAEQALDDPDAPGWITLYREVRRNGRNICRVNGRTVSLQILSDVAALLVDVHGQGEHLSLLQPRTHIHLLDRYAGLMPQRQAFAQTVAKLRRVRSELQRLRQDARTIAQRIDLLSFQAEEIAQARLLPGEEATLDAERRRLGNAEALLQLAQTAAGILLQGESELPGAVDLVGEAVDRLERLARIDPTMQEAADEAQGLLEQLNDLGRTLQDYADGLEFNPARLQEVEERVELIANLKRKYGDDIDQINAYGRQAQAELDSMGDWEVKTAELEQEETKLLRALGKAGAALSQARAAAGATLARQVETELADLRMARAQFGVAVEQAARADGAYLADGRRVAFDSTGLDQVEFLISANPGEPLKPMAKVASGGETARLMLALKSVLAHADATPTLIFDEIDQGIGGRVGAIVGQKLWFLTGQHSRTPDAPNVPHQILCITHLPQLAAFGDRHFTVNKRVIQEDGAERTSTVVRDLDHHARVEELTVMLGATSEAGRRSVEEMMADVAKVKAGD
jgi:DNA repair protein RecN (Recombination protein N)